MKGHFLLKPIAKIGDDSVRMYEFIGYSLSNEQQILERMADDIAFKKIIEETGVTVTEEEVQRELNALNEHSDISYETCLNTILHQKAIEKYASEFGLLQTRPEVITKRTNGDMVKQNLILKR